jgi:PAS domain S-box-containing protein
MESAVSSINILPFNSPVKTKTGHTRVNKTQLPRVDGLWNTTNVLSAIWEKSNEGMRLTNEKGIIISVNPSYCRLVGMNAEELVGCHFTCVYAETENREKIAQNYEMQSDERQEELPYEQRFVLWTKQILDVEVCNSYVGSENGATLLLSRFRDITSEKITHSALVESESKYRGLFANSVMPMFQCNISGKLLNANRAMLKLLGYDNFYDLAELNISRDIFSQSEEHKAVYDALLNKGYVVNAELKLKRKNGTTITVLENSRTVLDDEGKVIGFEGVIEDITARKAMQNKLQEYVEALEKSKNALTELNAQKDKLFSILSHDLRSPFSSILGFCDILLKENDQLTSEDRVQFVSYIQEAAQDQLALVNRLLDWSRLESGRIHMEQGEIDIYDVVKKSINSLLGLAHQKQVKLQTTLPANLTVNGDRQLLGQVFGNLIGNSLKFTPPNGTITVELLEDKNNKWVIGVRDTGVGIPENDLHKLFKVEEKYTRKGLQGEKGTGLGLPVVHEIIEKHHGNIEVASKVGAGTLFLITLSKSQNTTGKNILVVDDKYGIRVLHSRYIRRAMPEANILHAADGAEALQLARQYKPMVIISDYDMPDFDGQDLVRSIKCDQTISDIPIVIITGQDSDANREMLNRYGVSAILNKPVMPEQLSEILKNIEMGDLVTAAM